MSDSAIAIDVANVSHEYPRPGKTPVTALHDMSFQVQQGQTMGLLGPNGAGKTTLVRIISTLLLASRGSVRVAGMDVARTPRQVRRCIGVSLGGELGLYGRLSAWDNLRYFGTMFGLSGAAFNARIDYLLSAVGLAERKKDRVEGYSRGMKQRLHLARALLHDPQILILDEPSAGLDPVGARDMRELVKALIGQGRTVLLTTHDMEEADSLCDHLLLIDQGRLRWSGRPDSLRREMERVHGTVITVEPRGSVDEGSAERMPGFLSWQQTAAADVILTTRPREVTELLLRDLPVNASFSVGRPTLLEAYLAALDSNLGGTG